MTVSPTSYSYSGDDPTYPIASVEKPTVTVVDAEGKTLTKGVDYSLSFEPTTGSIASGHTVTLSAFTAPLDPDTTGQLVKTYTAHYSQNVYYTLSVFITPDGGGTVAGTPFGSYPYGTFYSLSAVSNSGYWFYKWDDGSSTNFYPNI